MARSKEYPLFSADRLASVGTPGNDDWYSRWIDDIADDVVDGMVGEPERQERMNALHRRLSQLHHGLERLPGGQRGRGPRLQGRAAEANGEDERIRAEVVERLTDDWYLDASDIELAVANGEVSLAGTVDSRIAKRLAEDCADDVAGVRDVANRLSVRQGG